MKGTLLLLALLAGCATANAPRGKCGPSAPVDVIVHSSQFMDVVIRDAEGRRLGLAPGLRDTRFRFCAYPGMASRFILDPLASELGYVLDGGPEPVPGSTVLISLGSELRISFAHVVPPVPE